jgi:hypothetical protein
LNPALGFSHKGAIPVYCICPQLRASQAWIAGRDGQEWNSDFIVRGTCARFGSVMGWQPFFCRDKGGQSLHIIFGGVPCLLETALPDKVLARA